MNRLLILFFFITIEGYTQEVLTLDAFLAQLAKNHPVAKQAQLRVDQANSNFLASKGVFDPVLNLDNSQKTLDGKQYYNFQNSELKVYTPIGVTFKTGLERSNGQFLNNEVTRGALSYAGFEMPILKGLLIDAQRAAVKQALIFQSQSLQDQISVLNELYMDAIESYWTWTASFQNFQIISQNLNNAKERLNLQRLAFVNGDRAQADTLEAFTQVQNIQMMLLDFRMEYQTAEVSLAKFLWDDQGNPYYINSSLLPDVNAFGLLVMDDNTQVLVDNAMRNHPDLQSYRFKLQSLEVYRKLKFQSMLPQANLKANILSSDVYRFQSEYSPFLSNNYNFGIDFKVPLFLREARGDYEMVRLKIKETNQFVANKAWEIENKIRYYGVEKNTFKDQILTSQSMVENFRTLLKIEELKFEQGESSLFLVNSRENKWIESIIKYQSIKLKYLKASYKQIGAAGMLVN